MNVAKTTRNVMVLTGTILMATAGAATARQAAEAAAPEPEGLLPVPDYSGALLERSRLLGDFGGGRTDLANKGVTFDLSWTQIGQGVIAGGRRIDWDYQGSLDGALTLDLHRMKLLPGALIRARVEGRYGESVNDDSGSLLPVNTDGFFPLTNPGNESIVTVTELNYTQFLSKTFGLTIGKYQTLDGDPNEFASGRGRSQFMNFNFIASGVSALTIPYSTLGGGIVWMPTERIKLSSLVVSTNDSSTTSGFEDLNDGLSWITEADFQYRLGDLPGGTNVGFVYAFDGDFTQLGGKLRLGPGGVTLPAEGESWCAFISDWQYVYVMDKPSGIIDAADGRQDLRGVGLFGRLGFGDEETNPVQWSLSGGVGARGLIPSRDADTCGLAFMYSEFQDGGRLARLALEGSSTAAELYYNIAVTPSTGLTFDVQRSDGVFQDVEEAWLVGARLEIRF